MVDLRYTKAYLYVETVIFSTCTSSFYLRLNRRLYGSLLGRVEYALSKWDSAGGLNDERGFMVPGLLSQTDNLSNARLADTPCS